MANILVIDDDKMLCDMLCRQAEYMKHSATYALNLRQGFNELNSSRFDVLFLDVCLPDGDGLDSLQRIRDIAPNTEIIIITGEADPDGAEYAIKSGAWDYIQKPLSPNKIILPLTHVLQYRESLDNYNKAPKMLKRPNIIGESPRLLACLESMAEVAHLNTNIFITGETGTGKELFAKAVHENSPRADEAFIVVDCAALPETIIESTLFGHEKGAFTGADKSREGLIKQADHGTLFLDEVGELSERLQKAFLRVLQERRYRPIGSHREQKSDFRLISATNRDLDKMVKAGRFREDLFHRLRTVSVKIPPLRERTDDILALTNHYTMKICKNYGLDPKNFSPDLLDSLRNYNWPGNVRELINALERAISSAKNQQNLFPIHLPLYIRTQLARASVKTSQSSNGFPENINRISNPFPNFKMMIETEERKYFNDLISFTNGNIKEICRISGLSRANVYGRLKRYNISRHF